MNIREHRIIIPLIKDAKTGGEKYLQKIYEYFRDDRFDVVPVYVDEMPKWPRRFGLIFDCLISNIWFLFKIGSNIIPGRTIIIEDFHSHPRLIFANAIFKLRQAKIASLMQSSLFYHKSVQGRIKQEIDKFAIKMFFKSHLFYMINLSFFFRINP